MAQHTKRKSSGAKQQKKQVVEMDDRLHSETDTKRMKPVVRSMVLGDLVFLAVFQLLDMQGMISEEISTFSAAVAAIVMIYAMVVQFKAEKDTSTGSGRRL